jgi:hypothetical protein
MLSPSAPRHRIQSFISGLEVPQALRTLVRARESSLIAVAALVGLFAGLIVVAMGFGVSLLHMLFGVPLGERLSAATRLNPIVAGGRAAKSTRSRPMRCMAGACRRAAA